MDSGLFLAVVVLGICLLWQASPVLAAGQQVAGPGNPGPQRTTLRPTTGHTAKGAALVNCHADPPFARIWVAGLAPGSVLTAYLSGPASDDKSSRQPIGGKFRVGAKGSVTYKVVLPLCPSPDAEIWVEVDSHPDGNPDHPGVTVLRGKLGPTK